ncbi:hypothetical protein UFOVP1596_50 [uncultured Caudovirales phage]|uniref:Uncharacterized protein n=1 Tax=uncultured Caudovirales phage TaxID=2100421 RepID=A0A6J5SWT0_9CAUD|nr:hypothetical protein UFOVP1596_50 [uncultured Caudovirales phage]
MRALIQAILTQLATLADLKYIRVWNNQLYLVEEGKIEAFPFPAVFVEFENQQQIEQLGGGDQLYEIRMAVHIVHEQLDAGNGRMEENLDVFDLVDKVFQNLQMFKPSGAGNFVRYAQEADYDHDNLYHFIQYYRFNYIDPLMSQPVGGIDTDAPLGLEQKVSIEGSSDSNEPYIFGP